MNDYMIFAGGVATGVVLTEIAFRIRVSFLVWRRNQEEKIIAEVTSDEKSRLDEILFKEFEPGKSVKIYDLNEEQMTYFPWDEEKDYAAKMPPNVGGVGNPAYQGPNYSTPEDIAEEMQSLRHYGVTKDD